MREGFSQPNFSSPDNLGDKTSRRDFLKKSAAFFGALATEKMIGTKDAQAEEKEVDVWNEISDSVEKLKKGFNYLPENYALVVNPENQKMYLIKDDKVVKQFVISTAAEGIGNVENSNETPHGAHQIYSKLGDGEKPGAVFGGDKFYGPKPIVTEAKQADKDLITTRVLKLRGLEPKINSGTNEEGKNVNSETRGIYIHGTNEEGLLGTPQSHGCIRMNNQDIIELYDLVPKGTMIEIQNKQYQPKK